MKKRIKNCKNYLDFPLDVRINDDNGSKGIKISSHEEAFARLWNCVTRSQLVYCVDLRLHETGRDHVLIAAVHRHNKFIFFATPFPENTKRETRFALHSSSLRVSSPLNPSLSLTSMTSRSHEFAQRS